MMCYFCRGAIKQGYRIEVSVSNGPVLYSICMCQECSQIQLERSGHLIAPIPHYGQFIRADENRGKSLDLLVRMTPFESAIEYYRKALL